MINKSLPKDNKGIFTKAYPMKTNASLFPIASQYSGAVNACKHFAFPMNR